MEMTNHFSLESGQNNLSVTYINNTSNMNFSMNKTIQDYRHYHEELQRKERQQVQRDSFFYKKRDSDVKGGNTIERLVQSQDAV